MTINSTANGLQVSAKYILLPFIETKVENIVYTCKSSTQIYPLHQCDNGNIAFRYAGMDYQYGLNGWFDFTNNSWDITLSNANKSFKLHSNSQDPAKFMLEILQMSVPELSQILKQFVVIDTDTTTAVISAQFSVDTHDSLTIKGKYNIAELSWESTNSEYILAESVLAGQLTIQQSLSGVDLWVKTNISAGEGLFKDIYILFDDHPVQIVTNIKLNNNLDSEKINLQLSATDAVKFDIDIIDWANNNLTIDYNIQDLSKLYQGFLASYFEIIGINDLEIAGATQGSLSINNGKISSFISTVIDTYMVIESKKIEIENLNATINWQDKGELQRSDLAWDKLLLAGMPVNKSSLQLFAAAQKLQLQDNAVIPIFDGSIIIYKLLLEDLFKPQIAIVFDGEVTPISLALITEKMGWQIMHGSLAGKIPGMKKIGNSITFAGLLELKVFDGAIQIDNLTIERLFGIAPVIAADINFQNLNLQQITSTFDFGEITGLITGYVNAMRITNWKVDRLDGYIESVKTKGIKQTISQRAIDNISSIGGIQGALSRSFLRFFKYFKYKHLGIGCKLRNAICEMRGLQATGNTYHLIEGKGIPSINIIGFRAFINWEVFLDRLLKANF